MRPASTRLLQSARVAVALALVGALVQQSWTFRSTVEFIAFVILTFAGVMRIMTSRRMFGLALLLCGLALYPLVAAVLPLEILGTLDVIAAILLISSMPRQGAPLEPARAILYAASLVAVLSALLILFVSNRSLVDFLNTSRRVNHTYSVIAEIDDLSTSMRALESMQRAYVLTGAPGVLVEFQNHERSALRSFDRLGKLVSDNPLQSERVRTLRGPLSRKLAFMNDVIETLSGHLWTTHVHDNGGKRDEHLLPYAGTIDWDAAMMETQKVGYDGPLMFEVADGGDPLDVLKRSIKVRERLEKTFVTF